jgi:hypothetical protein
MSGRKKQGMRTGHTHIHARTHARIHTYIHTHTHTHTKRCEKNKGERRVEDKGIKVHKKFPIKCHRKLTLMKVTGVLVHYMEAHRGNGLQLHLVTRRTCVFGLPLGLLCPRR